MNSEILENIEKYGPPHLVGNFELRQNLGDVDCIQYSNDSMPTDIVTLQIQSLQSFILFQGFSNGLQNNKQLFLQQILTQWLMYWSLAVHHINCLVHTACGPSAPKKQLLNTIEWHFACMPKTYSGKGLEQTEQQPVLIAPNKAAMGRKC